MMEMPAEAMPQQQSLFSFYSKGDALRCNYEPTSFQNNDKADPMKGSYVQLQKQRGKTQWQMLQLREENDKLESLSEKSIGALNSDLMGREMDHVAADYSKSSKLQPFPKAHSFEAKPNDMTKTRKLVSHADKRIQQPIDSIEQSPTEKTRPFNQCYDHVLYQNSGGQKQSIYQDGASELCAPHTPALRPLVPGIRRIRDSEQDILPVESFISDPVKRRKLLNALGTDEVFNQGAWAEARLKFDWLHPTNIRDGDGRKASDPFFDRRTVEVPEKVFNQLSASQKQYWSIKSQYMDTVLFFKVGKFYELYELDAEIGHKELDWKITLSGVGKCRQVGVSESGIDEAVQKLVARGYKVGRMEQIETAAQAKALRGPKATIQRELMQVLTPSTLIDGNLRPEAIHLLALKEELSQGLDGKESCTYGFAFVDAAVGRFYVGSIRDTSSRSALGALLTQLAPQELLYELGGLSKETHRALQKYSPPGLLPVMRTPLQPRSEFMDSDAAVKFMLSRGYFKHAFKATAECFKKSKESWPEALNVLPDKDLAASALGALSSHIQRLKSDGELLPNAELYPYEVYRGSLRLDGQTTTNLELLKNSANGSKSGSLLGYLDSCCTVFGKRLLHRWICHPLQNLEEINERLDAVDELILLPELTSTLRAGLRKLPDLERMIARIRGLAGSPNISFLPGTMVQRRLKLLCSATKGLQDACELLRCLKTCVDSEGHPKAHILREASAFLDGERVGPVFAEMMSIIDQNSSSTKETFQQKDDTEDGEHAGLLFHLLSMFNEHQMYWSSVVEIIARLDVLSSFVVTIHNSNGPTCRPKFVPDNPHPNQTSCINGGSLLNIKGLWHPFATGGMGGVIVPNDVQLGMADGSCKPRAMLVTGPNMGGKSTLLRATCLAIIMAQLGCYVPGESCIMSIVDIIFTRIGASDRIMSGESTFLVECTEAASILQHATSKSLVVLDELGRGTSTFDGYAIAYAVFRHLIETLDCRLLFATHYHPLTEEFSGSSFVSLQHMACSFEPPHTLMNAGRPNQPADTNDEWNKASDVGQSSCPFDKQLVFLYKLKAGACPRSYGLQVASLAGIPESIVVVAAKASEMIHSCLNKAFQAATDVNTELSHIQKQWLKSLITAGKLITFGRSSNRPLDCAEDAYDTFLCLWHEMRKL